MSVELSDKRENRARFSVQLPLMNIKNTFTAKQHCRLNKVTHTDLRCHIFKTQIKDTTVGKGEGIRAVIREDESERK